jgi:hypothetical protein
MAYETSNPPRLLIPSIGGGLQVWGYQSTHASTVVAGAGFFSNGAALGMRVGDVVLVVNSTSGVPYVTGISTVNDSSAATVVPSTAT